MAEADITPAAATGGAACINCGSTERIAGAYLTAAGRRDRCAKCGVMLPPAPFVTLTGAAPAFPPPPGAALPTDPVLARFASELEDGIRRSLGSDDDRNVGWSFTRREARAALARLAQPGAGVTISDAPQSRMKTARRLDAFLAESGGLYLDHGFLLALADYALHEIETTKFDRIFSKDLSDTPLDDASTFSPQLQAALQATRDASEGTSEKDAAHEALRRAIRAEVGAARADGGAVREAALSPREIAQEIVLDVLADEHQDRVATFASYRPEIDRAEALIRAALAAPGVEGPAGDLPPSVRAFMREVQALAEIEHLGICDAPTIPHDEYVRRLDAVLMNPYRHVPAVQGILQRAQDMRDRVAPPAVQPREDRT